jgi:hypothetical protein
MNGKGHRRGAGRWAAGLLIGALTQTAPAADIEVELRAQPERVYRDQHIQLFFSVRTRDVRLANQIRLTGLFEDGRLTVVREFRELAPERRVDGLALHENRRFVCVVSAAQSGPLELRPVVHLGKLEQRPSAFGRRWVEMPVKVAVDPLRLNILPLPEPPANFSGAVGQFRFEMQPSATTVAVGDLITLRASVSGTGSLTDIAPPRIDTAPGFRVYDPLAVADTPAADSLVTEQILVPRSERAQAIPAVSFVYFDPTRERYVTEQRGPFPLTFRERPPIARDDPFRPPPPVAGTAAAETTELTEASAPRWRRLSDRLRGRTPATTRRAVLARIAPAGAALVTFRIPADVDLTQLDTHNGWSKVEYHANRGWIPSDTLSHSTSFRSRFR